MAIVDKNGKDFFEGFFDRPLAEPEVPSYLSPKQQQEYGVAAEQKAAADRAAAAKVVTSLIPYLSQTNRGAIVSPKELRWDEMNEMDLAAWEKMQQDIEAAGGKRLPAVAGTNTGKAAAALAAQQAQQLNPLDALIAGLFGDSGSKPKSTPKPAATPKLPASVAKLSPKEQQKYLDEKKRNATLSPSGSSQERYEKLGFRSEAEMRAAVAELQAIRGSDAHISFDDLRKYNMGLAMRKGNVSFKSSGKSGSSGPPITPTTPTTPTTPVPGPVQALDIPYVKAQSLWIQDFVKSMFAANLGISRPTKPSSSMP